MKKWSSDASGWVQKGKTAAATGKTADALTAVMILVDYALVAANLIIENQHEILAEIKSRNK